MHSVTISPIEFVAEDLTQLVNLFTKKLGFRLGLNPSKSDGHSLHLVHGEAHVRLTPAMAGDSREGQFVAWHGSAVLDVGLRAADLKGTVRNVLACGVGSLRRAPGDIGSPSSYSRDFSTL